MGNRRRHLWRPGRPHLAGFTFVEVLAVLGLVAILLLVAVPRLFVPETLTAAAVAHQIAVDLRLARQLAIARRVNYALEFSPAALPFTTYTVRDESTLAVEPDFPKELPSGVTVSGRRTFTFVPSGCVDDDGVGDCAGTDGTVTVAAGTESAQVQVSWSTGRVTVVEP